MNNCVTRSIALAIATLWSSGCATTGSDGCPALVNYAPEVSARLAEEIESMAPGMITPDIITDYFVLRQQVRACRQEGP